ncbi:MAG: hypothetical protein ACLFP6_03165 [Spirochaetaceae bacterium]
MKLLAALALLSLLASCLSPPVDEPPEGRGEPEPRQPAELRPVEREEEDEQEEPEEEIARTPVDSLLPPGMALVLESGSAAVRRGDWDADGEEDLAYLALSGAPVELDELGLQANLSGSTRDRREPLLILRLASGEDLLVRPGSFLLLQEFSSLSVAPRGSLVYLRFEEREQQRHLLFGADPTFKSPQRYLFVTDTRRGFFVRDVDDNGEEEIIHLETELTPRGIEESYFTLYQFHRGTLQRRSRVPLVERTGELLTEVRRLLLAGEDELLLRRYARGDGDIDAYLLPADATPLSELRDRSFVFVPDIRSNPFNLADSRPTVTTEILVISGGEEHIFEITVALRVEAGENPELKLLSSGE